MMSTDLALLAEAMVERARQTSEQRRQAIVVREEGDSYSIWYDIFVVGRGREREIGTVSYEHGRGRRLARELAARVGNALGLPVFRDEWSGGQPWVQAFPAPLEIPVYPEVGLATLTAAINALMLPKGFVQQVSGLDEEAWHRARPRCLQEDLRLSMLLREHAPLIDGRAFIRAELDGSMAIWAALALAELGWAPLFLFGPELHRGHNWSNVMGALKHVAHPLVAALAKLDERAPVCLICDKDVDILQFTRRADEDAAIPPLDEGSLERISFETMRERLREDHAARMRDRRRAVLPGPHDIAAHHHSVVTVVVSDTGDTRLGRYNNGVDADLSALGVVPFYLAVNPFVEPTR